MALYAAKCYWPGVTRWHVERAGAMARLEADGPRYLGALVFPDDELVLCLFEAVSAAPVAVAAERAGMPCERLMPALWADESRAPYPQQMIGRSV